MLGVDDKIEIVNVFTIRITRMMKKIMRIPEEHYFGLSIVRLFCT